MSFAGQLGSDSGTEQDTVHRQRVATSLRQSITGPRRIRMLIIVNLYLTTAFAPSASRQIVIHKGGEGRSSR